MIKLFKRKLIIILIATVATITIVSISTKTIFELHNAQNKKVQALNVKEKNTTEVSDDKQDIQENNTKELELIADIEETASDNDVNNQETINSQIEQQSNNQTANQKNNNLISENLSNSSETNKQEISNYQVENQNNQQTPNVQQVNENNSTSTTAEVKTQAIQYDRTTTIYANDNITLLRVEYYLNNKLTYYSVVEQFDATTKSYIEKIYKCNLETNINPLVCTREYKNGNLIKSY